MESAGESTEVSTEIDLGDEAGKEAKIDKKKEPAGTQKHKKDLKSYIQLQGLQGDQSVTIETNK